ncbi:hypothetical protein MRX96_012255 [Rhipicephalus microplus]
MAVCLLSYTPDALCSCGVKKSSRLCIFPPRTRPELVSDLSRAERWRRTASNVTSLTDVEAWTRLRTIRRGGKLASLLYYRCSSFFFVPSGHSHFMLPQHAVAQAVRGQPSAPSIATSPLFRGASSLDYEFAVSIGNTGLLARRCKICVAIVMPRAFGPDRLCFATCSTGGCFPLFHPFAGGCVSLCRRVVEQAGSYVAFRG